MKFGVGTLVLAGGLALASASQSATMVSFDSVSDSKSWDLSCTGCDILAFDEDDDDVNSGLSGSLGLLGDAFDPVNGGAANPSLNGDAEETSFLASVAALFGDTIVSGSFVKNDTGAGGTDGGFLSVSDGDYVLWKAGTYAGVAKVLTAGTDWMFDGSHDLSHFAKISTTSGGGGGTPVVPLPAGLPLLLTGLGAVGLIARRRKAS